jgi:O-antigen ligase
VLWSTLRHLSKGLTLGSVGWAIQPFYLNHVIYAATVALFLPFALYGPQLTGTGKTAAGRWAWRGALGLLVVGVTLAYTRASWLAVIAAGGYYLVLRWRLVRPVLLLTALAIGLGTAWLVSGQHFLRFKPDYEHTVWNGHDLGKHLASTVEFSDASEMERVYRWVAASRMVAARPWLGTGPSSFYPEYKKFTDKRFRTYVSDNPERSTTHNYFLLQLVEQGIPGFVLFLVLIWWALVLPQTLYHRTRDPRLRAIVLASGLSLVITICHLTLNELVEVDKIGSFFFISLALLLRAQGWIEEEKQSAADAPRLEA